MKNLVDLSVMSVREEDLLEIAEQFARTATALALRGMYCSITISNVDEEEEE